VTATRGERGRFGELKESPGPEVVGRAREAELLAAATELGLREVRFLDYMDGALDKVDTGEALEKIAGHLRRVRPQVVITFGPDGSLYVLQIANPIPNFAAGGLFRIAPDGTRTQIPVTLTAPGGIAIANDGAIYITNNSTSPTGGQVLRIRP